MEDSLINAEQVASLETLRTDTLLLKMEINPGFVNSLGVKGGASWVCKQFGC